MSSPDPRPSCFHSTSQEDTRGSRVRGKDADRSQASGVLSSGQSLQSSQVPRHAPSGPGCSAPASGPGRPLAQGHQKSAAPMRRETAEECPAFPGCLGTLAKVTALC